MIDTIENSSANGHPATHLEDAASRNAFLPGSSSGIPTLQPQARDVKSGTKRIQELIETVDALPDVNARVLLHECLQSLMTLYGQGLERILQLTQNAGAEGATIREALLRDKLVRGLLLIHDLHPDKLEARVRKSLDTIRPYLESHGGNVELISILNDVARLRLQGTCRSCPSSSVTLELAVRQAIEEACPDLAGFEVEGAEPSTSENIPHGKQTPHWTVIDGFAPLSVGEIRLLSIDGEPVIICRVNESLYAYRNRCTQCNAPLNEGTLADGLLRCQSGHSFDIKRAGIGIEDCNIHLYPLPLLALNGTVKIAARSFQFPIDRPNSA